MLDSELMLLDNYPIIVPQDRSEQSPPPYQREMVPLQYRQCPTCLRVDSTDDCDSDCSSLHSGTDYDARERVNAYMLPILAQGCMRVNMALPTSGKTLESLKVPLETLELHISAPITVNILLRIEELGRVFEVNCAGGITLEVLLTSIHRILHSQISEVGNLSVDYHGPQRWMGREAEPMRKGSRGIQIPKILMNKGKLLDIFGPRTHFVGLMGSFQHPEQVIMVMT